jgi:hypothetical protein
MLVGTWLAAWLNAAAHVPHVFLVLESSWSSSSAPPDLLSACKLCTEHPVSLLLLLLPAETELQLQQVVWVLLAVKGLCGVAAAAVAKEAGRGWVGPLVKVSCGQACREVQWGSAA